MSHGNIDAYMDLQHSMWCIWSSFPCIGAIFGVRSTKSRGILRDIWVSSPPSHKITNYPPSFSFLRLPPPLLPLRLSHRPLLRRTAITPICPTSLALRPHQSRGCRSHGILALCLLLWLFLDHHLIRTFSGTFPLF